MGQGQVSDQSGISWSTVITASSYKVAGLLNYVTHQYINTTQNTSHKTSPCEGWQSDCSSSHFVLFNDDPTTTSAVFLTAGIIGMNGLT